jgi:hypothetical protein
MSVDACHWNGALDRSTSKSRKEKSIVQRIMDTINGARWPNSLYNTLYILVVVLMIVKSDLTSYKEKEVLFDFDRYGIWLLLFFTSCR